MKPVKKITAAITAMAMAATLMLCGCSGRSSDTDTNEQPGEKFGTYKNLTFECNVPSVSADKFYEFKIERNADWSDLESEKDNFAKMVESFYGTSVDRSDIKQDDVNPNFMYLRIFPRGVDETTGKSIGDFQLYSSHTFLIDDSEELGKIRYKKNVKAYAPFIDLNKSSEKVTLNGKEIDLQKFVKTAEDEIKRCCMDVLNEGETIKPYDAVKMKSSTDSSEYITLRFSHIIEGLPYNQDGFGGVEDGVAPLPSYIAVEMNDQGKIASVSNPYYFQITEKKEAGKIMTVKEATDHLSNELAPNVTYSIKKVDLKYVCVTNRDHVSETARPMWCYKIEDYDGGYGSPSNFFLTQTAFVDAINGNIYIANAHNRTCEVFENKK